MEVASKILFFPPIELQIAIFLSNERLMILATLVLYLKLSFRITLNMADVSVVDCRLRSEEIGANK